MKPVIRSVSAVLAVSALFLSPVAGSLPVFGDDAAYAKDKGGGGGGKDKGDRGGGKDKGDRGGGKDKSDRGGGRDKGGDEARSAGNGNGNGWGRKDKAKPAAQAVASGADAKPRNHGALASGLKGANAANASEQAFANAAPNSQVGRVATYRAAVQAEAAGAALPGLEEERDALLAIAEADRTEEDVARLAELETEIAGLTELAAYDGPTSEEALLEATKGRELSYEEKAYLHDLLGLEPPADPALEGETAEAPAEPAAEPEEPVDTAGDDLPAEEDENVAEAGEVADEGEDLAEAAGDDTAG